MSVCPGCGRCSHCGHTASPRPYPNPWTYPRIWYGTSYPNVQTAGSTGTFSINAITPEDPDAGVTARLK